MRRSRYFKLFMAAIFTAIFGLVLFSAAGAQQTFAAANKAARLAEVPINAFSYTPLDGPQAGQTEPYYTYYGVSKTMKVTVTYVKPKAVTKVVPKPKPTRWVNGNPVWVRRLRAGAFPKTTLTQTFASNLKKNQKIVEKFIFRAKGYRPDVESRTLHVSS